jgi:hypothetical protein
MQRTFGNRYVQRLVQAKLEVSHPADSAEREADAAAERIMALPDTSAHNAAARAIDLEEQPNPAPMRLSQVVPTLGRATDLSDSSADGPDANGTHPHAETAVAGAANSVGEPLPPTLQRKFENALGADLAGVRVHTGSQSVEAAHAISARAYTIGSDIHFNQGEYDPHGVAGQRLLAHELAHTGQQGTSPVVYQKRIQRDDAPPTTTSQPAAPAGQPATVPAGQPAASTPTTVDTLWTINVQRQVASLGAALTQETSSLQRQQKENNEGDHFNADRRLSHHRRHRAAPEQHYLVGGVSYTEKQYEVAVVEVADLWTAGNGIVAKQKTAVARFCSKSAAGADKEPDLFESAFHAAVMAIIGIATDGVGLAVGAAAEAGTGKLISLLPKAIDKHSVEAVTKKVLDAAIDKGKERRRRLPRRP